MKWFIYVVVNVIETLLRAVPVPCKTGLVRIGRPGRGSPVFLTCNYHLTVVRVKHALKGLDAWLLVANSKGYNVWCGATGGHFTGHSVIAVLKTSGIEALVDHRDVILPQLAATGIEGKTIREKSGWNAIWGPVYAPDIPAFVETNHRKTVVMREVRFPPAQRIEMALMWAFPFSIIASLLVFPFSLQWLLPLNILIWGWSLLVFITFPLYSGWFERTKRTACVSKYTVLFDFSLPPLILWLIFVFFLALWSVSLGHFNLLSFLGVSLISLVILLLLNIDLMGSTPVYKSGLHEERYLQIFLDTERCRGAGYCESVCPKNCFEVDAVHHAATMPRAEACVQCGACVVQCPFDALYFRNSKGEMLPPATVREYKLNLMGKRMVKTGIVIILLFSQGVVSF